MSTIIQNAKSSNTVGQIGSNEDPTAKFRVNVSDNGKTVIFGGAVETSQPIDLEVLKQRVITLIEGLID